MILIPIRTEMVARRTPTANYALIAANCLVYVILDVLGGRTLTELKFSGMLHADSPYLYQFFTYQFLHDGLMHIGSNMLFLWVFGNSVNVKMGNLPYLLFYLAGGVFAAWSFALGEPSRLLGASGAIAAITTAYLALFPRSRVTVLFIFFFISFIEVPAMILIGVKIILWDNIIGPRYGGSGGGNVAFAAHLGGYFFGFVAALVMLMVRAVPRDQFDVLALVNRWNRRRAFQSAMSDPAARRRAEFGTVGRAPTQTPEELAAAEAHMDRITDLRTRIAEFVRRGDLPEAARDYEELLTLDPNQCLPDQQQLMLAREFYGSQRPPQAARAFERYLTCYPRSSEVDEIRLLLGIIYARDLQQYGNAEKHLAASLEQLRRDDRRDLCRQWLESVRQAIGRPATDG